MNIRISIALFLVALLIVLNAACNTSNVVTTTIPTEQPTEEELNQTSVSYPEIPRITAEELRLIMETEAEGNFILVDVRSEKDWDSTRLRKAVNIPNVSDDPLAQQSKITQLQLLPKDKAIIFYGDSPDDSDAASLAQQLIGLNAGYDLENVKILLQGHPRWKELRYPTKDTGA
ncbi:rhodanese-like domain-containing protein [Candidatus Pacearchaeota archaeon]|nr:rhodanese-like domain-containing protein [Candidatus Pacearchaeota archaeon]